MDTNKFSLRLNTIISEEFGDVEHAKQDLMDTATELLSNITQMKKSIEQSELQISHILEELNSSLGREIRKMQPKMNVNLANGSCGCGYHSKDIVCKPDLQKKIWVISGRLGNGFKRTYPESQKLTSDMRPMAQSMIDYFKKYYRSL